LKHHREHARESERDEIIAAREQSIRRRNLTGASEGVAGGWRVLGGEAGMNRETLEEEREVEEGVEIDLTFPGGPRRRERGGRERMRPASMQGKRGGTLYPAPSTPRLRPRWLLRPVARLAWLGLGSGSPRRTSSRRARGDF